MAGGADRPTHEVAQRGVSTQRRRRALRLPRRRSGAVADCLCPRGRSTTCPFLARCTSRCGAREAERDPLWSTDTPRSCATARRLLRLKRGLRLAEAEAEAEAEAFGWLRAWRNVRVPIALRTQLMSQPGLAAHPVTGVSRWSVPSCVGMEQFERLPPTPAPPAPTPRLGLPILIALGIPSRALWPYTVYLWLVYLC